MAGWLELIGRGIDPADEVKRRRREQERKRRVTFAAVADDYLAREVYGHDTEQPLKRTVRRTDDPDITFVEGWDPVMLWCYGIVEWRVDQRDRKFLMTPIYRDGSEGPIANVTEAYERFSREYRDGR